jgi:DNA invertase Pin-like site-specific DNA recombinase
MKIGYARVSTDEQSLALQMLALKRAECDPIFTDQAASGANRNRCGLNNALASLERGDVFVVWRLDRLGRSLSHLVALVDQLGRRGIEFESLTERIDTHSSGGMLMFHMMAALAEFERALIRERTLAGLAVARANGKRLGRKPAMSGDEIVEARNLLDLHTLNYVAEKYGVHPRTLRRIVKNSLRTA